jgi:hypothetical protein
MLRFKVGERRDGATARRRLLAAARRRGVGRERRRLPVRAAINCERIDHRARRDCRRGATPSRRLKLVWVLVLFPELSQSAWARRSGGPALQLRNGIAALWERSELARILDWILHQSKLPVWILWPHVRVLRHLIVPIHCDLDLLLQLHWVALVTICPEFLLDAEDKLQCREEEREIRGRQGADSWSSGC